MVMPPDPTSPSPGHFLRRRSGLVRAARPFDVLVYNLGLISIGIAISLVISLGAPNYPGASVVGACVIGAAFMAAIALGFWSWTATIPRSGGIYVFLSRGLHPGVGFALSFVDAFTWLFYNALAATLVTSIGVMPLLFAMRRHYGISQVDGLLQSIGTPSGQLVVGLVALVIGTVALCRGVRWFFILQKCMFIVAMLGTIAALVILARSSPGEFRLAYDRLAGMAGGTPYDGVAAKGATTEEVSWLATLRLAAWPFLSFVGSVFSIAIGGEVQRARRSQAIGMFGSLGFAAVALALLASLTAGVMGSAFLFGVWSPEVKGSLPVTPHLPSLLVVASESAVLSIVMALGFLAWAFFWIPATLVYAGRVILAWSFDRLAPAILGRVDDRLHSPVYAIIVTFLANTCFLILFIFTDFFSTLSLVLAAMLSWIPTMICGALLPYSRPTMYRNSDLGRRTLLGLPIITVSCGVALAAVATITVLLWNDPIAAGHSPKSLLTIGAIFSVALLLYWIARRLRKRQGFDLTATFKEIPIE